MKKNKSLVIILAVLVALTIYFFLSDKNATIRHPSQKYFWPTEMAIQSHSKEKRTANGC
jgi:hypothetical protein